MVRNRLLVLVLVLIRVVGRIHGKSRVDLWGTRRGHVGLWNAVVVVVHGHGPAGVVLRVGGGWSEVHGRNRERILALRNISETRRGSGGGANLRRHWAR